MVKIKKSLIEISIVLAILLLLFSSSDPILHNDSHRYLKTTDGKFFFYPYIILMMQKLFNNLNSVVFFQTILASLGIIFFTKTIASLFKLDVFFKILITLFLFLPIIESYRNILTEAVCYAFSLFLVSLIIKLIYKFSIKNICLSSILIIVLLLTRQQFVFLYPLIFLLYLGLYIIKKSRKNLILLAISFLSIIFLHNSLILLNKYKNQDDIKNKTILNYNSGPFYFTYVDAIYVSDIEDIKLFDNQNFQKTLGAILQEMNERKALMKHYNSRGHFSLSFNDIRFYSDPLLKDLAINEKTTIIELKKEISIKLISKNYKKYIKHIFKKMYDSTWLFTFMPFFILICSFISFIKKKSNYSLLMMFLSIFTLSNHSLVYLFGRVQPRYLIYSDFIILIFILITFTIFFQKKSD